MQQTLEENKAIRQSGAARRYFWEDLIEMHPSCLENPMDRGA